MSARRAAAARRAARAAATARAALGARALLIGVALVFLALFLVVPLAAVFAEALREGRRRATCAAITRPGRAARRSSSRCSTAAIAVPLNLVFGVAAAWAIAQVRVPRQEPADHADRPAVRGLAGHRGPDLRAAVRRAGLVRAVARRRTTSRSSSRCRASCSRRSSSPSRSSRASCIPLMQAQGSDEEEAALVARRERLADLLRASRCRTSSGACSTASSSATRARWASSARSRSSRATSAARPTRCRCTSRSSTTSTTSSAAFAVASLLALLALVTLGAQDAGRVAARATASRDAEDAA